MKASLVATAVAAAAAFAPAAASAQTYKFQVLQYPGAMGTNARAIDPTGAVLGYYYDSSFNFHGFTYAAGAYKSFDAPGQKWTSFTGGNGHIIIGEATDKKITTNGFTLDSAGTYSLFSVPGSTNTYPESVDAEGTIVGYYNTPSQVPEEAGFILKNGKFTTFEIPNAQDTEITCLLPNGVMVGSYRLNNQATFHGYMRQHGKLTTIDYPGAYQTSIEGINTKGVMIGYYSASANAPNVGFTYDGTHFTPFEPPADLTTWAYNITKTGAIVGFYFQTSGTEYGFVGTPGGHARK